MTSSKIYVRIIIPRYPNNSRRKEIEMKRVIKVALILIPYLLLGALVVAGVVVMEVPVTQKTIDLLEKGMTFSEVFEVLKRDIVITPISAEDAAKVEYYMYPVNLINILGEDYEIDSWGAIRFMNGRWRTEKALWFS